MAGPSAEKPSEDECGDKRQNHQNYSGINNPVFEEGMEEFLEVQATDYFVAKIIYMRQDEHVNSHQRSNAQFLYHGYGDKFTNHGDTEAQEL
ncbi:uncharacterized protein METZ01_LOCUS323011 [marine metagenome]|uniref:Uncharacterized protein n=1 Tax=marine metagenome TaxID=408172 RepID=A0A382PBE1_9ZZZZ